MRYQRAMRQEQTAQDSGLGTISVDFTPQGRFELCLVTPLTVTVSVSCFKPEPDK